MSSILTRYSQIGLAGELQPGRRPALLVVDLQHGFTDPACGPGFTMPDVISQAASLVESAHENDVPVIFTTIAFPAGTNPLWVKKMPALLDLREGSTWTVIDPATGFAETDRVIVKQAASAFSGTDLAERLADANVDTVVICGATTSGCIRATAVDAISLNLRPFVVGTAVGDRERSPHEAALVDIQAKYGEVISLEQGISILQEQH